ncbi:GNAT family N-acetyltransferase [Oryzifoliimicrobium ureilyticus]|uniref:GNAT family N-acetyltransferase n=1 Tax=Oryzifoliimicrobium ureilyticus TaxID=3113724 RepID=UPI0030765E0D
MKQQLSSRSLDVAVSTRDLHSQAGEHVSTTLELISHPIAVKGDWEKLEKSGCCSVYQTREFVSAWTEAVVAEGLCQPAFAGLKREGRFICLLPFAIRIRHGLRIAEFVGGTHSNHNLPLFDPDCLDVLTTDVMQAMLKQLAYRLKIDAYDLRRQPLTWNGVINPLASALSSMTSATIAQDVFLEGGFDALLKRHRGSSKRKKLRAKERIFASFGGYEILWGNTPESRRQLLSILFKQKAQQFSEKGMKDVFADQATRRFFFTLAEGSGANPILELAALQSAGVIRAVRAYAIHQNRLSLMMQSYTEDELSRASPGETLLFRSIEEFCKRGFQRLDFGVGRERYKDSWADAEFPLVDSLLAVSTAGRAYTTAMRLRCVLERKVRNNKKLWTMLKKARRFVKGRESSHHRVNQTEDD